MSEIVTTTGKSIGDYEDYHDGHSDVAYFESDAVIPLAGKYAASDETKTTKSVRLATVLGGGSAPANGGGIELNNGELQLQDIDGATENQVPYKTNNGIVWKEPAKVIHGNGVNVGSGAGFSVSANLTAQGGLSFDDGADGLKGIKVTNPVPAPNGDHSDQGKVLTVNNSDQVVWAAPSGGVEISGYNGEFSVVSATNDASSGGYMFDVNHDDTLAEANENNKKLLTVANPVPSAESANTGDVLTNTADGIAWVAPQGGGGGGGNPYTKVNVTPEAAVLNGKSSDQGFLLFDQSVNIANNTLSVIPGGIGYENRVNPDPESWDLWSKAIDVFKIILPAGTDFPMAVVEFPLTPNQDASINTIEVYVGNTKLAQIRDVPYREDAIVGNSISAPNGIVQQSNYWEWANIYSNNLASGKTAIVNLKDNNVYPNPKVQVHIFGSCYRVMASIQTEQIPAS